MASSGCFFGGTPRTLKVYLAPPPAGGPGPKARTVAKFHFLKRCTVLENESSFQKYQHFSCPKDPFFLDRILKNRKYFTRISEFFRKIILNFQFFWYPKISTENWLFSQFSTKYFLEFWLRSESIYLWQITSDFYNNFSYFGGGGVPASPPLPTLLEMDGFR